MNTTSFGPSTPNAVDGNPGLAVNLPVPNGMSAEAAVSSAAFEILTSLVSSCSIFSSARNYSASHPLHDYQPIVGNEDVIACVRTRLFCCQESDADRAVDADTRLGRR